LIFKGCYFQNTYIVYWRLCFIKRGIYRIKTSDFSVCEVCNKSYKKCSIKFPEAIKVAKLFKKHKKLNIITDYKDKKFLKGGSFKGKPIGARINILPDGKKLNKMYSLFSPELKIHDEKSNIHWDVIYKNPNGAFAYLYTIKKESSSRKAKYKKVYEFEKCLSKLNRNLNEALGNDVIALPILILLKTKMRVGNEIYYKQNHHKGLTTLKKRDITINRNNVSFSFIGKDGVPQKIVEKFSKKIINQLKSVLKTKKRMILFSLTQMVTH